MIIDEKGLARCLSRAYKKNGYTMLEIDGDLCLYTDSWFIRTPWKQLPRKALAAIVEHAGYTYVGEDALHICKDLEPQPVMADVVAADLDRCLPKTHRGAAGRVPVTVRGLQLFQTVGGEGACYGANPLNQQLLDSSALDITPAAVADGSKLVWRSEEELVIIAGLRPVADEHEKIAEIWKALEAVDLH